ncbi:hypothetical protein N7493_000180 [Penicillium malachiteum]|uniref:Uncharacterized protein n=1 Tax=Penicillium malachiteum TaxID=1324776 RepID=A0AAD6N0G9_9EURO|nr:hypothetical protein N7493_000180 [Penicillium malachiteum]
MTSLASLRMASGRLVRLSNVIPATSSLHTTAARRSLKETDKSRDDLSSHYEAEKADQLRKTKEGTAKWREGLASNSEADVKADRGDLDADCKDFQQMQEQLKKEKAAGKSP